MELECVYPAHRRRHKRLEKANRYCVPTQRDTHTTSRPISDKVASDTTQRPKSSTQELSDNLQDVAFDDDSYISESLFEPWMMSTAPQYDLYCGSTSPGSSLDASPSNSAAKDMAFLLPRSRSITTLPELSTIDTHFTSSRNLIPTEATVDLDFSEDACMTSASDTSRATSAEGQRMAGRTKSQQLNIYGKMPQNSESCQCLLSSISFLERLVAKEGASEGRFDRLLRDIRQAMESLAKFMACEKCVGQAELSIVLAMAARQMAVICAKMANSYKALHAMLGTDGKDRAGEPQQRNGHGGPENPVLEIMVSTYRVNQREGLYMLKSLVTLQITELEQHINTMAVRYSNQLGHGQTGALHEAKSQISHAQRVMSSDS
ncbi:hypothetical protein F5Y18DRAFT_431473 [Xylariaceae sp. FL1019]|nr:hypothetical protein F5Y18DRAFT_431473 [Xylariaceae sp. FL1019]